MGAPRTPTAPFADVALLSAYLVETIDPGDLIANAALEAATAAIQSYCDQTLALVEDDVAYVDGSGTDVMLLPEFPVTDVAEVIENYDLDSPRTLAGPGNGSASEFDWTDSGLLLRRRGGSVVYSGLFSAQYGVWPTRRKSVKVTYTHGYAVDTEDLGRSATVTGAAANIHIAVPGFNADRDTLQAVFDVTADAAVTGTADGYGIKVASGTIGHQLTVTWATPTPLLPADIKLVCVAIAGRTYAQDGANSETSGSYTAQYAGQPATITPAEMKILDRYRARRR